MSEDKVMNLIGNGLLCACGAVFLFGASVASGIVNLPAAASAPAPEPPKTAEERMHDQNNYCFLDPILANDHGAHIYGVTCWSEHEVWVEAGFFCHANPKDRVQVHC